jgi:chemotaxis protein CheC
VSTPQFTDLELDALRELANIGSGTASTALSAMIGREVDVSVPKALALPLADAVDAAGPAEDEVTGVVIPVFGSFDGIVLLLFQPRDAATMCGLLGVEAGTEWGDSALGEIGNILGSSYVNALASMAGLALEPGPPAVVTDLLAALVASAIATTANAGDTALLLDSDLRIEGEECSLAFLLLPALAGVEQILGGLGLRA